MTENWAAGPTLSQAQDLQNQILEQRQEISLTSVEGSAGGGAVKVSMLADGTVVGVA